MSVIESHSYFIVFIYIFTFVFFCFALIKYLITKFYINFSFNNILLLFQPFTQYVQKRRKLMSNWNEWIAESSEFVFAFAMERKQKADKKIKTGSFCSHSCTRLLFLLAWNICSLDHYASSAINSSRKKLINSIKYLFIT